MASRGERYIAAVIAVFCGITTAVSLSIFYTPLQFPVAGDLLMHVGERIQEIFLNASWYLPVFFLFLTAALIRGDAGKKSAAFTMISLIPFITTVFLLYLLSPGQETRAVQFVSNLFTRQASIFIVSIILALQLLLFLLGLRTTRRNEPLAQKAGDSQESQDIPLEGDTANVSVTDANDRFLRFPFVPDLPELATIKRKQDTVFIPIQGKPKDTPPPAGEDQPEQVSDFERQKEEAGEPRWEQEQDELIGTEKPAADLMNDYQIGQTESSKEMPADQIEQISPLQRDEVDLKNTVTPTLPPEDPHFQNIVEHRDPEKEEQEEIDKDWKRREAEEGVSTQKKPQRQQKAVSYQPPSEDLLSSYPDVTEEDDAYTQAAASALMKTFEEFGIDAKLTGIQKGPVVTMFEILPAPGVRVSSITNLSDNIALQLAASRVRIVAPIPGKQAVGIEVPNRKRTIVSFQEMLSALDEHSRSKIPMVLGKDIMGELKVVDLVRTPHLLIAGATGSGKSVCVNSLICSILYRRSPRDVRLMLIDPKIVELKLYNDIPHLLTPVITDSKKTLKALQYCIYEMERRYTLLDSLGVRDISSYNAKVKDQKVTAEHLPYIVVVLDEFADLMNTIGKELENYLARLAAMARAVGIHLVLATQRPSTNVITGLIKANIPSRIAFMVVSNTDSRIIIDMPGAEKLLGRGDMLFLSSWEAYPTRIQGAFLSEEEVERVAEAVKANGEPDYLDESYFLDDEEDAEFEGYDSEGSENDPLMPQALRIVQERSVASASMLQRRLKIGYNRAARMIETMEEMGVVGPAQGSKPRDVLRFQDLGDG